MPREVTSRRKVEEFWEERKECGGWKFALVKKFISIQGVMASTPGV